MRGLAYYQRSRREPRQWWIAGPPTESARESTGPARAGALAPHFNGRLRDESSNVTQFPPLDDGVEKIERWRTDYNDTRPRRSLGNLTPSEYARKRQETRTPEAAIF